MSQFARPESDVVIGLWTDDGGGVVNLFDAINEVTPSDADFVQSETIILPGGVIPVDLSETLTSIYVTKLSSVEDPGIDTGFILRVRLAKNLAGGNPTAFFVELLQDYQDEITKGSLIAARTLGQEETTDPGGGVSGVITTFDFPLTEGEAIAITDFSNLFLRFQFSLG